MTPYARSQNSAKLPEAPEGTAGIPTPVPEVYFNSGLAAFSSGNFAEAYQCLSSAATAPTFVNRPGLWAKIGEACLGIWEELKLQYIGGDDGVSKSDGKSLGLSGNQFGVYYYLRGGAKPPVGVASEDPGSDADLEEVRSSPIPRAMHAYETAVSLVLDGGAGVDIQWLVAAVGLCYCNLEVGNYEMCVEKCVEVLDAVGGIDSKQPDSGSGDEFKSAVADMRDKVSEGREEWGS